jgi:hypothetical protein
MGAGPKPVDASHLSLFETITEILRREGTFLVCSNVCWCFCFFPVLSVSVVAI